MTVTVTDVRRATKSFSLKHNLRQLKYDKNINERVLGNFTLFLTVSSSVVSPIRFKAPSVARLNL